jgi:hypothetical protein
MEFEGELRYMKWNQLKTFLFKQESISKYIEDEVS